VKEDAAQVVCGRFKDAKVMTGRAELIPLTASWGGHRAVDEANVRAPRLVHPVHAGNQFLDGLIRSQKLLHLFTRQDVRPELQEVLSVYKGSDGLSGSKATTNQHVGWNQLASDPKDMISHWIWHHAPSRVMKKHFRHRQKHGVRFLLNQGSDIFGKVRQVSREAKAESNGPSIQGSRSQPHDARK
jgi:hypothetical protein